MRKALLLYNPLSGGRRKRRLADVEECAALLRRGGVDAVISPTESAERAQQQALEAIAAGYDTIFACGGDGTIHDLLQVMVGTAATLGVIPLGTGNTLAHDIRVPLKPAAAARESLRSQPRSIPVGRLEYQDFAGQRASAYFTVSVGIGVDAHLFYHLDPLIKRRFGMTYYYSKATWLWLTHPLEYFQAEIQSRGEVQQVDVSQLLAVRIRNFGGILRELAPGASLDRRNLRLVLFRTRSRLAYLRYIVRGLVGARRQIASIDLTDAERVECRARPGMRDPRVFVEADGELLGTLPATITMAEMTVNLLVP